ncbi:hypothetical protein DES53_115121 [Roseimicrobium gellanilyticum]|uniref:Uncharacterized protein n=1 Tax=Roseimicrobium gellanilyticum TaxID=748857 RepID=A0A366H7L5_9BACT|nr:hypothetical protein [Roseimicrobium gellanilyticum]RBP36980.1 hypothetical protein DES53_115121 [Roseimicrobium gellanilyticum]
MSLRIKIATLIVLLMLVGIPAGYVALTFRPRAPLEFHLESMDPAAADYPLDGYRPIEVRVKNSSPASIIFHSAELEAPGMSLGRMGFGAGSILAQDLRLGRYRSFPPRQLIIPAYKDVLVSGAVTTEAVDIAREGGLVVRYHFDSRTYEVYSLRWFWMVQHFPELTKRFLPTPKSQSEMTHLQAGEAGSTSR